MNLHDELIWLADSGGCTPNGAPGVHDGLAAGDSRASLHGAVLEAAHHKWDDNIALLQKQKPFRIRNSSHKLIQNKITNL